MTVSITPDYVRGFTDRSSQVISDDVCVLLTSRQRDLLAPIYAFLLSNDFRVRLRSCGEAGWELRCSGIESLNKWLRLIGPDSAGRIQRLVNDHTVKDG